MQQSREDRGQLVTSRTRLGVCGWDAAPYYFVRSRPIIATSTSRLPQEPRPALRPLSHSTHRRDNNTKNSSKPDWMTLCGDNVNIRQTDQTSETSTLMQLKSPHRYSEVQPVARDGDLSEDCPPAVTETVHAEGGRNVTQVFDSTSDSRDKQEITLENEDLKREASCKVCMDNVADTVFLPCCHLVCCELCTQALSNCPVCRKSIIATVKAKPVGFNPP